MLPPMGGDLTTVKGHREKMDPDATLETIRSLTDAIQNKDLPISALTDKALELADAVTALDDWLHEGGFFPGDWMPF